MASKATMVLTATIVFSDDDCDVTVTLSVDFNDKIIITNCHMSRPMLYCVSVTMWKVCVFKKNNYLPQTKRWSYDVRLHYELGSNSFLDAQM